MTNLEEARNNTAAHRAGEDVVEVATKAGDEVTEAVADAREVEETWLGRLMGRPVKSSGQGIIQ